MDSNATAMQVTIGNEEDDVKGDAMDCSNLPKASPGKEDGDGLTLSAKMTESIAAIHSKIEDYTEQTLALLEGGKQAVTNALAAWEQSVIQSHEEQINRWQQEINHLEAWDHTNANLERRLHHAQSVFNLLNPGKPLSDHLPQMSNESQKPEA